MKRCAFLSMDSLEDFVCYDELLIEPFRLAGWNLDTISWRADNIDWNEYDVVNIRSTWDYQDDHTEFIKQLEQINESDTVLANDLDLVKWNIDKKYLLDLEYKGIEIVPSRVFNSFNLESALQLFDTYQTEQIVIKPTISANADNTFRLSKTDLSRSSEKLQSVFRSHAHIIQPFIDSIITEGEYSLFYFGGEFSHCILKTPKRDDFRVQEEHGGVLKSAEAKPGMIEAASKVFNALPAQALYARIDFVRSGNSFLLMEVELIEPSLYFNMDEYAAQRYVDAFIKWYYNYKKGSATE